MTLSGLEKPIAEVDRLVRLIIIGILLAGIIVGSAIATGIAAAFGTEETQNIYHDCLLRVYCSNIVFRAAYFGDFVALMARQTVSNIELRK